MRMVAMLMLSSFYVLFSLFCFCFLLLFFFFTDHRDHLVVFTTRSMCSFLSSHPQLNIITLILKFIILLLLIIIYSSHIPLRPQVSINVDTEKLLCCLRPCLSLCLLTICPDAASGHMSSALALWACMTCVCM